MRLPLPPIAEEDRLHILDYARRVWPHLKGKRFFITGATGFYGKWILESLITANERLDTGISAILLSRDPAPFFSEVPHLANRPEFEWLVGDITNFAFPKKSVDFVLHFATTPAAKVSTGEAQLIVADIVGTERILRFAKSAGAKRLLYASSGAVYGPQPADVERVSESYRGAPDPTEPKSAYGEIKRVGELLCGSSGVDCVIARGFSFIGPYLPLNNKFAAGSFVSNVLAGGPIRVGGGATIVRSYMYAADLTIWLLVTLVLGKSGTAYNVGSDTPLTIADLANLFSDVAEGMAITTSSTLTSVPPSRYVPEVNRATSELRLQCTVPIAEAIRKTLAWASPTLCDPLTPT